MNNPLVSICIPTYNGEKFIAEALESVISQSYKNVELVISDDHSQDNTVDITKNLLVKTNIPYQLLEHEPSGIGANWNNCITHANGSFIKFLFQDDVLEPNCIEKMVNGLNQAEENTMIAFCKKKIIGNYSAETQEHSDQVFDSTFSKSKQQIFASKDFYKHPRNKFGEPTCSLIKIEAFGKVGMFDNRLRQSLDYEFWYRVLAQFEIIGINQKLVKFRLHSEQATERNRRSAGVDAYLLPRILLKNYSDRLCRKTRYFLRYKAVSNYLRYRILKNPIYSSHNSSTV